MNPHSIVCNRRRLVSVKFYLNRCRFAVVIAKCLGGSLFWGHTVQQYSINCWSVELQFNKVKVKNTFLERHKN